MHNPSPQEALVYLMVIVSASDRDMTDPELARIGAIVRTLPVFSGFEQARTLEVAQDCQRLLEDEARGLDSLLDMIAAALSPALRETAYALAVDIAVADRSIRPEENRILQLVRDRFGIDRSAVTAIDRAASIRHRRASD